MNEYCTCGAQLVDGALFCHKCGRPVRELSNAKAETDSVVETVDTPVAPSVAATPSGDISFQNPVAVRVAMWIAIVSSVVGLISPLPVFLQMFWRLVILLAAGFVAVYVYHRRTGQELSVRSGVRLGWLTGLFSFAIVLVLAAISMVIITVTKGGLSAVFREQMQEYSSSGADVQEAMKILESPEGLLVLIFFSLLMTFLVFTGLPMLGGALGAKVIEKE